MIKHIAVIFTIAATLVGGALLMGRYQEKADKVDKVEIEVREVERRLDANEQIDIRQSVIQERTVKILDDLEKRF